MDSLLLRALNGESTERAPVWLMRQAGRYMAEYRALKEQHGFLGLCRNPELACEVTLQPIRAFYPDAAIIFADILLPAEGMGFEIEFNPGPKIGGRIRHADDVSKLKVTDPLQATPYVLDALKLTRSELKSVHPEASLLGFAGTPWTMACYLCDQGPYKHFLGTQVFAAQQPKAFARLLDTITEVTSQYLAAQFESGAEAVQLFDSWGGNLTREDYKRLSLPYIQKIIESLRPYNKPVILYVNGGGHLLSLLSQSGANCLSIDSRTSLPAAEELLDGKIALQGNLDPTHLFRTKAEVIEETRAMLSSLKNHKGYVANLGHGILQATPPENVKAFIDTVKEGW